MHHVVAFKGVKLSDYGGRSISTYSSSQVEIDPDIQEAHTIRAWWESSGKAEPTESLSSAGGAGGGGIIPVTARKMISDIHAGGLGMTDKVRFTAMIWAHCADNFALPAGLHHPEVHYYIHSSRSRERAMVPCLPHGVLQEEVDERFERMAL